jgi:dUTP pyrophosphatase
MNLLRIRIKDVPHEIRDLYEKQIKERDVMDAGFDLFIPDTHVLLGSRTSIKLDHKVQIEYYKTTHHDGIPVSKPSHIMMIPRSSMSKTSIRLANSVGLIDAGYRGNLMAFVDNLGKQRDVDAGTALFQLIVGENCEIQIVDTLSESKRGTGGFGSTGNI